jgi:hypothetical protein
MLAIALNDNDKKLLSIIFKYGGYMRARQLHLLYPDLAERTIYKRMDKLVDYGFLAKRRFATNSKIEPVTYQVTQATCVACGNPNSTYRRKRPVEYAVRALIKNMFFLEIHDKLEPYIITELDQRRAEFEKAGFKTEYFPQKLNYSKNNELSSLVQFEEFNIDFRKPEGKQITNQGQVLYADAQKTMIVVHIDQSYIEIKKQLHTLVNRYINMIKQNTKGIGFPINFLVVTDQIQRKSMYESAINEIQSEYQYTEKISNSTLQLYKEFYRKLAKKDSRYTEASQAISTKFDSETLRTELIERAKNYKPDISKPIYKEIESGLKKDGIQYLVNKIFDAVRQQLLIEDGRKMVEEYFNLLFYFELHNIYKADGFIKNNWFEMKVYCTENEVKFM